MGIYSSNGIMSLCICLCVFFIYLFIRRVGGGVFVNRRDGVLFVKELMFKYQNIRCNI